MSGYVYIMKSEQRPDICKVGRTSNTPSHRCSQLNSGEYLSVTDWKVAHSRKVQDSVSAEKKAHDRLSYSRLNLKKHREAFKVDLSEAIKAVDSVCDRHSPSNLRTDSQLTMADQMQACLIMTVGLLLTALVFYGLFQLAIFGFGLMEIGVDFIFDVITSEHVVSSYEPLVEVEMTEMEKAAEAWEERRLLER